MPSEGEPVLLGLISLISIFSLSAEHLTLELMVSQFISPETLGIKTCSTWKTLKQTRTFYIRQVFKYIKVDFSSNTANQQVVWTRSVMKYGQFFPAQQILIGRPQKNEPGVCLLGSLVSIDASEITCWRPQKIWSQYSGMSNIGNIYVQITSVFMHTNIVTKEPKAVFKITPTHEW